MNERCVDGQITRPCIPEHLYSSCTGWTPGVKQAVPQTLPNTFVSSYNVAINSTSSLESCSFSPKEKMLMNPARGVLVVHRAAGGPPQSGVELQRIGLWA